MNRYVSRLMVAVAGMTLLANLPAQGQGWHLWDGGGADNNWSTAANWNPDGTPPNPTTNYVNLAGTTRLSPVVNTNWTILGLFISNNAGAFVLSGSNITVTASQVDQNPPYVFENRSTNTIVVGNGLVITATTNARRQFVLSSSGGATFNGMITNANYGNGLGDIWIRGPANGAGAATVVGTINGRVLLGTNKLSKLDTVTWVVGTNNNLWGDTDIYHTGVLRVAAADALPTNTLVTFIATSPGGRLDLNNFNQTVAGLSAAVQSPAPAVRLGTNAGGRLTINSDNRTNIFYGNITENGTLWKMGTSRQILMTNSTFTGNVVIAGGVLQLGTNRLANYFNAAGATPAAVGGRTLNIDTGAVLDSRGRDTIPATVSLIVNGTLTNEGYTMVGPVTLGNGRIDGGNGYVATHQNLAFRNSVTVTGTAPSYITGMTGAGNSMHLEATQVVFDVRDVTTSPAADLLVSAVLANGSGNVTNLGGGILKQGAGTMQLDNYNTFTGTAVVAAGTLALGASGSASNAIILTGTGGVFDVSAIGTFTPPAQMIIGGNGVVTGTTITLEGGTVLTPGLPGLAGSLTVKADVLMSSTYAYTNQFDLTNNLTAGGGNDLLTVMGSTFEPQSSLIRINPLAPLTAGTYRLINYTAPSMGSTFATPVLGNTTRDIWSLEQGVLGQIDLIVTQGVNQTLVWGGLVSSNWDIGVSTNWAATPGPSPDAFYNLDAVLFDDTGATSNIVNIATIVKPASVTVSSSSNYTFSGPGRIKDMGNATWLTKDGTGTLIMALTNDYSGITIVSNGTLQLGAGGTIGNVGAGAVFLSGAGVLEYFRNDGAYNFNNPVVGNGTLVFRGPGASNQGGYQIGGINTGFVGSIVLTNARLQADAATDVGNATQITAQNRGQLYVVNIAVTQPVQVVGIGWQETAGQLGAIRLQGGTLNGAITLAGDARIGAYGGNGNINNQITGPYELEYWNGDGANQRTVSVGSPVLNSYGSTRVSSNIVVLATNPNAFATGPLVMNGGILRVNGMSFSFSNLTSTTGGGTLQNNNALTGGVITIGADGGDSSFGGVAMDGAGAPGTARAQMGTLGITKVGAGALMLANNTAGGTNFVAQGSVIITNGSWSGPLTIASGASATAEGGSGLLGEYYLVNSTQATFDALGRLNASMATLNPSVLYKSTAAGTNLDFGGNGANFPPGFNNAGVNFQARWVGKLIITNAGTYTFGIASDDGSMLWIDGAVVATNNIGQGITNRFGTATLAAGQHDIVYGFWQGTGGYGFTNSYIPPGGTNFIGMPNAMLASGAGIGSLNGDAGSTLYVSNGLLGIAQAMPGTFNGDISGNGGIYKIGSEVLVLNGNNAYTGATVIAGGWLIANQNLGAGGRVTVQAGGTLGGTGAISGSVSLQDGAVLQEATQGTIGTLSLAEDLTLSGGASNIFDFSATTNDMLDVAGVLTPGNAMIFINPTAPLAVGQYPIVTRGSISGSFSPYVNNLNPSASGAMRLGLDYATAGEVRLVVNAGKTLVWNSPINGNWDVQNSNNWKESGPTNEAFWQGDAVVLDDTPGVTQIVTIASGTNVWPASITVNTDTNAFTVNIAGALRGNFAVVKNGTNTLTLNDTTGGMGANQNFGSGGVTVNSGRLVLFGQNDGAKTVGPGLLTINQNGILQTDSANTFGQAGTGSLAPVLLNGGRFRPNAANHMNQFVMQSNAVVERYNSAGGVGLDFYAVTGTPSAIYVLSTASTITNAARMTILNSTTNTTVNIVDSAPAIDAEFSGPIYGSTTKFLILTNAGTLLLSGSDDNNTLAGVIENGTLLLGKTGAGIKCFGAGISNALTIRGAGTLVRLVGPGPDQINAGSGITMHSGTFDLNGWSENYDALNGTNGLIINSAAGTMATNSIGENGGNGSFGGVMQNGSGVLALRKLGAGTQILTAGNSYTGGSVVANGTLALSNSSGSAIVGNVQVGIGTANSVLRMDRSEQLPDSSLLTFASGNTGTSGKLQLMGNTETVAGISIVGGTISVIQNAEAETVNGEGRLIVNDAATDVSIFNDYIRDRSGGTGTGKLALVKAGAGTLAIGGVNLTYSGPTILSNGILAINGPLGASPVSIAAGTLAGTGIIGQPVTVDSGITVQPGFLATATALTMTTVTFNAGSTINALAGGTNAILRVNANNGLTIPSAGAITINAGTVPTTGTYVLVDYAGTLQGGTVAANVNFVPPPRFTATVVDNIGNSSIDMNVTALGEPIKWTGVEDDTWNINSTTNWQTQAGLLPTAYLQPGSPGDAVIFDDSAGGSFNITIPAAVNPSALVVSNSVFEYSLGGAAIGGGVGLVKWGAARLSISNQNTFGGASYIQGGRVAIAAENSLGAAPGSLVSSQLVMSGGTTLEFLAPMTMNGNRGIVIGNVGAVGTATFDTGANNVSLLQPLANIGGGTGGLAKTGSGILTLMASNSFSGPIVVSAGQLKAGAYRAFANNSGIVVADGAQVNLNGITNGGRTFYYTIAGSGTDGNGAIISTNVNMGNDNGIRWLTLTSNATVGAMVTQQQNENGRHDLQNIQGNHFTLTKTGYGPVSFRQAVTNLQLVVAQGMVYTEGVTNGLGTNVIVNAGGAVGAYGNIPGRLLNVPVTLNGGILSSRQGWTGANPGPVTWAGPVTLTADSTIATRPGMNGYGEEGVNVAGNITGPYALSFIGLSSNIVLTGTNTYSGGNYITNGIFVFLGSNTPSGDMPGGITNNGNIVLNRTDTYTLGGVIHGSGTLSQYGTGTSILTAAGSTLSGSINVTNGVLIFDGGSLTTTNSNVRSISISRGATVIITNNASLNLAGHVHLGTANGTAGIMYQYSGSLIINGIETAQRSFEIGEWPAENSSYHLLGGICAVTNFITWLPWNAAQGLWNIENATATVHTLSFNQGSSTGTGTLNLASGRFTVGPGGIVRPVGTSVINLSGGTVSAYTNWGTSVGMTLTGSNAPAAFDTAGWTITMSNVLSGAGGLVKSGIGTLALLGANTFTGPAVVSNGTLQVMGSLSTGGIAVAVGATLAGTGTINGHVTSDGIVAPGASAGTLNLAQTFTQTSTGSLQIEIGGTIQGVTHDYLIIGGTAAIGGELKVSLTNGFTPAVGDTFIVLQASTLGGTTFTTTNLPSIGTNLWTVDYAGGNLVILSVTNPPPSGPAGYDLWAGAITNGLTNATDSASGDGYPNLLKYATGSNPNNSDNVAQMNRTTTNGMFALKFNRNTNATDLTLIIEGSFATTNEATWNGIATNIHGSWGATTNYSENTATDPASVVVWDTEATATNRFLRLRVTRP